MSKFKNRSAAGYTLTEIMIVLLIMSLMAGISGPALRAIFPNVALESDVRRLESALLKMQREAVQYGTIYEFAIESQHSRFIILKDGKIIKSQTISSQLTVDMGDTNFEDDADSLRLFLAYPDGHLAGSDLEISTSNQSRILSIDPFTGRLRIK